MSDSTNSSARMWDALPSLVWASGTDAACRFFNRKWLEFTGRTLEEETGDGWAEGIHSEDREQRLAAYRSAFESREPFHAEYRLRSSDGTFRWIADEANPVFDDDGEFCGFLGCALPIERDPAVEGPGANQRLASRSGGGVFRMSPNGACRQVDEWWTSVTGMEPGEAIGGGWLRAVHADDRATAQEKLENCFRNKEAFDIECRLTGRQGEITKVRLAGAPCIDEGGILTGYDGSVRDVETGGDAPMSKLDALNVLAGSIAHDFNNQLTPILLNLSMAQSLLLQMKGEFIDDIVHRLRESEEAALHAKTLANRLLAFGQGGNPVKEIVDLGALIRDALENALHSRNIKLDLSLPADTWNANVDSTQISEVIFNLVANAAEAMENTGALHVTVSNVARIDDDRLSSLKGPHIAIRIQDEGPGIRFDVTDRIFDPFFSTKPDGDGLGLPTAQAIVRNHGGDIVLDSDSRVGAIFVVYLPAANAVAPAAGTTPSAARADARPPRAGRGAQGRVLVMDDEDLVRSSMAAILKALGYEVETARNGEEALAAYTKARDANNPIDCALMDLTIHGGMGGKEAICRLRQIDPAAKAVVCSGYSNDMIMNNYRNYGFMGAIQKPFQPDELNRVLQDLIHS